MRPEWLVVLVLFFASCGGPEGPKSGNPSEDPGTEWAPEEGRDLLGAPAPAWNPDKTWLNAEPIALEDLRGKVVLIRFWLVSCPYCKNTAPALNELYEDFADQGLVVIGFHHPKQPWMRKTEVVKAEAKKHGFEFPLAQDNDWEALRKYWSPREKRRKFTSVSFLLDQEGVIRWLHDGGEFHTGGGEGHEECNAAYRSLRREIERLLAK